MKGLPTEPTREVPPPAWWQRPGLQVAGVILVAAIVTLAVLAIAGNWFGGASEPTSSPGLTPSPTTGGAASPSPGPSTGARPSIGSGVGATWTTVATFPGASASDVIAGGPGWVAVGAEGPLMCDVCPGLEAYTGKIWTSADGRSWDEVAVTGLEASNLYHVAAGPDGLVAIGWREDGQGGTTQVLVSPDGVAWTRVAVPAFEVRGTSVNDIIGGSVFVAVGDVPLPDFTTRGAVWTSTNGRDWQEVFRSSEEGPIQQVTVGGPGWVAVGTAFRPGTSPDRPTVPAPAIWRSPNAITWTQQDLPLGTGATAGESQAVLNAGPGLVAVGYAEYSSVDTADLIIGFAGWRSADGVTWEPAPVTPDFLEDIGGGHLLYESDDRVFAIGSGCRCGTGWPGRWWTAPDGLRWTQHQEPPPILYSVIPFDGGLLGVGIQEGEGAIFLSQ